MKLKFEDFQGEKLSKNQQKVVRGGDDPVTPPPVDPGKRDNNGNG